MRSIDPDIVAELSAQELRPFLLLDMEIDSVHYRYTDCDVPIMVSTDRFDPRGFRIDQVRYSLKTIVDSMSLETDNLDDALTAAFVGGTPQGAPTTLKLVVLDSSLAIIVSPVTWFEGEIDAWGLDEEKISMMVVSELSRWNQRTLQKHSASCRWKEFTGAECQYAGTETWCDRSYTRCTALGNTDNFGGFRYLPSIMDKEIWWGRERKV